MSPEPLTTLRLYSEDIEGRRILHALDLPGCFTEGMSEEEALGRFPATLTAYAEWLGSRGETPPRILERFQIVERFDSYVLADGYEVNALFSPERRPPDRSFIARCQRLLAHSRADLFAAWHAIPVGRHDGAPTEGARTPRQMLDHVARAECWYLSNIADTAEKPLVYPEPVSATQLSAVRTLLLDWLDTASPDELELTTSIDEEEWTVRKVLRRALWHERTHAAELVRYVE